MRPAVKRRCGPLAAGRRGFRAYSRGAMSETAPSGVPRGTRRVLGLLEWPERVTQAERRSLVAGGLGWMLDAMDVMLYSLVLAHLMRDLGMDKAQRRAC